MQKGAGDASATVVIKRSDTFCFSHLLVNLGKLGVSHTFCIRITNRVPSWQISFFWNFLIDLGKLAASETFDIRHFLYET
jgi:hypothetical protein